MRPQTVTRDWVRNSPDDGPSRHPRFDGGGRGRNAPLTPMGGARMDSRRRGVGETVPRLTPRIPAVNRLVAFAPRASLYIPAPSNLTSAVRARVLARAGKC